MIGSYIVIYILKSNFSKYFVSLSYLIQGFFGMDFISSVVSWDQISLNLPYCRFAAFVLAFDQTLFFCKFESFSLIISKVLVKWYMACKILEQELFWIWRFLHKFTIKHKCCSRTDPKYALIFNFMDILETLWTNSNDQGVSIWNF